MQAAPSFSSQLAKRFQNRINRAIPEKIHQGITAAIKQMTRAVFFGAAGAWGFGDVDPDVAVHGDLRECSDRRGPALRDTGITPGQLYGLSAIDGGWHPG